MFVIVLIAPAIMVFFGVAALLSKENVSFRFSIRELLALPVAFAPTIAILAESIDPRVVLGDRSRASQFLLIVLSSQVAGAFLGWAITATKRDSKPSGAAPFLIILGAWAGIVLNVMVTVLIIIPMFA